MKKLKSYLLIILGLTITAAAISLFYVPNKIVSGGVSGVSTILYHTLKIPTGVSFGVINLVLLLLGMKFLGKSFTFKTLAGAGFLSLMVQAFSYLPPVTDDIFLAAIFGSILYGFGIGLTLICGASSGGTDILARLISMPNVIVTSHQAFLTEEALSNIAETTVQNLISFFETNQCPNELCYRGGNTEDCKSGKCF